LQDPAPDINPTLPLLSATDGGEIGGSSFKSIESKTEIQLVVASGGGSKVRGCTVENVKVGTGT